MSDSQTIKTLIRVLRTTPETRPEILELAAEVERDLMAKKDRICDTCAFFVRGLMQCRRYAPARKEGVSVTLFPIVNEFDWCGEYEMKQKYGEHHG